jgi:hypothetical protein
MASARLVYERPQEVGRERHQQVALRYNVTRDRRSAEASAQPRVQAMVASYDAAQAQLRASQLLNQGNNVAAAAELERAERAVAQASQQVRSAPARARLRQRAAGLRRSVGRARTAESPAASRAAALEENDAAMSDMGY